MANATSPVSANGAYDGTATTASTITKDSDAVQRVIESTLDSLAGPLRELNRQIHSHPETAYQEVFAHDTLTAFLETQGFTVTRHAYGLSTSFEADMGAREGPLVVFCAEYDALPGIGHACGHNLIATSSLAAFVGAAAAHRALGLPGRLRILGTPAEEAGGGKAKLIEANAFADPSIAAAIMVHPVAKSQLGGVSGVAGVKLVACYMFRIEFRGKTAHAAAAPWNGVNALDAAVAAYNNIAMLRQQMELDDRVHGVIEEGGTVPNVIPEYTRMNWFVRSPTIERANRLLDRLKACFEAAAKATGCELSYIYEPTYMNLRENQALCQAYVDAMAVQGESVLRNLSKDFNASTDMGNVSHTVPSFHGFFAIDAAPGAVVHNPAFTAAAGTDSAHDAAIKYAKGMAMVATRLLVDDQLVKAARNDFEQKD